METQSLAQQLRVKRSEMMMAELEDVALRLFEEHGFGEVTIEEVASHAHISVRTFYRYFAGKEEVLLVRIDRRNDALRTALSARPVDEPPFRSLRLAYGEAMSPGDTALLRRWMSVIAATPSVLRGVIGGIQLKTQPVLAEFFASRLGVPGSDLVPTMLAAATIGVIQTAHTRWYFNDGDLATTMSESLAVLEHGLGPWPPDHGRGT